MSIAGALLVLRRGHKAEGKAMSTSRDELRVLCSLFGVSFQDEKGALAEIHAKVSGILQAKEERAAKAIALVEAVCHNLEKLNSAVMPEEYDRFWRRFAIPDNPVLRQAYWRLKNQNLENGVVSRRLTKVLRREGMTLIDACLRSTKELLLIPGLGQTSLNELQSTICELTGIGEDELDLGVRSRW